MDPTHIAELTPRREVKTPNARAVPLDWNEFSARFFPHGRRHDLEAIVAYGAYRARSADRPPEDGRSALGGSAVMVWDWEGGAAAVEDSQREEVNERARTTGVR